MMLHLNLRTLRPLRLCGRYSEFRLRLSRTGTFVVSSNFFLPLRPAPAPAFARHEIVGFFGPPGTGLIVWKISRPAQIPDLNNRIHERPSQLHPIMPREQRRIALDAVLQKRFVRLRRAVTEGFLIIKIEAQRFYNHVMSG